MTLFSIDLGHFDIVKIVIANEADINAKDNDDLTALILAAEKGHPNIVKLLIEAGADVDVTINERHTLFTWATENGNEEP